jgi:hypothetical protein
LSTLLAGGSVEGLDAIFRQYGAGSHHERQEAAAWRGAARHAIAAADNAQGRGHLPPPAVFPRRCIRPRYVHNGRARTADLPECRALLRRRFLPE